MPSFFDSVDLMPSDPILGLPALFNADPRENKVNLGIGSYKTADGKSFLLNAVRIAEERIALSGLPKDYLPVDGDPRFVAKMIELNLGKQIDQEKIFGFQTVGGTGALRIGAEFILRSVSSVVAISNPTWPTHKLIFNASGLNIHEYPYYNQKNHTLDFEGLLSAFERLPPGSVVLLQAACHNPTGQDLTKEQWQRVLEVVQKGKLLPFFDNAYQGFGKSLEEDAYPLRLFYENGVEMMIACSYAKNFGLYRERVGGLIFTAEHPESIQNIKSQVRQIARTLNSTAPAHGALIVAEILSDPLLEKDWIEDLRNMRERLIQMRENLAAGINAISDKNTYEFIASQRGFFSLLGLSVEEVIRLREEKGIYMLNNSRINIAGLTPDNLEILTKALV